MAIPSFKRLVVKVGSALLVERDTGQVKDAWLRALCDDLAQLARAGTQIVVVSSGAIALGRGVLGLATGNLTLDQSQAAAAVGQIALAAAWRDDLRAREMKAAQVLLTLGDTEERRRYLNARATLTTLLDMGCVPVINENDTVATSEIRYGDNDRLAARVAGMIEADGLILLSDIDGLYSANPQTVPEATFFPVVEKITPEIESMAGGPASEYSRGGMKTKIDAAKIATAAGCTMIIANGRVNHPVRAIREGEGRFTLFKAVETPMLARKKWIAGAMAPRGSLTIDAGAAAALRTGKSLLPAGIVSVAGTFGKGDVVAVLGQDGADIARGLVTHDSVEASQIKGLKSDAIAQILGPIFRAEMIHRDDMVLL